MKKLPRDLIPSKKKKNNFILWMGRQKEVIDKKEPMN